MPSSHIFTTIVIGAIAGLFAVAIGYAQLVWWGRRRRVSSKGSASAAAVGLTWACGAGAVLLGLSSLSAASLSDREGFLVGERLFSVRPRPGLMAHFKGGSSVRRDDPLVEFTLQDWEDGPDAIKIRRASLQRELEIERRRPLVLDPELARRAEAARAALAELKQRKKQLDSESDAIARERSQHRFAITSRAYRLEQDDRAIEGELSLLLASSGAEQEALRDQEMGLPIGYTRRLDVERKRASLAELESRAAKLSDQRNLLAKERKETDQLRAHFESTYDLQLSKRSSQLTGLVAEVDAARAAATEAAEGLEQDRQRAQAQRAQHLEQLGEQLEAYEALLNHEGPLLVTAPFDGRVGFFETSPASKVSDGGPLLVLYRPGQVAASVRLDAGEAGADLDVEVDVPASSERVEGAEAGAQLAGKIMRRRLLADGGEELLVACDPPPRVVRQLAMGGTLPVKVHLSRGLTGTWPFKVGVGLACLAVAFALGGALHRHPREGDDADAPAPETTGGVRAGFTAAAARESSSTLSESIDVSWSAASAARPGGVLQALHDRASGQESPWASSRSIEASGWGLPGRALSRYAQPDLFSDPGYLLYLLGLGAALRRQVDVGAPSREHVREVREAIERGEPRAAALVSAGFGPIEENSSIESAAFRLLSSAPANALAEAARDCAEFLHVLRAIAPRRLLEVLDQLRAELIASALDAAERSGTSSEAAATLVSPLVEA